VELDCHQSGSLQWCGGACCLVHFKVRTLCHCYYTILYCSYTHLTTVVAVEYMMHVFHVFGDCSQTSSLNASSISCRA